MLIGLIAFMGALFALFIIMSISLVRDSNRATRQYNAFRDVFMAMLNNKAKAFLKLDSNNLSNLYDSLTRLSVAMSQIKETSVSTEMSLLSALIVDRLNRFALERTKIRSRLTEVEEVILNKPEAEETIELTELVEEEPASN